MKRPHIISIIIMYVNLELSGTNNSLRLICWFLWLIVKQLMNDGEGRNLVNSLEVS